MKNNIGKCIKSNDADFQENMFRQKALIPFVENVRDRFEALDPSFVFTNAIWLQMQNDRCLSFVSSEYNALMNDQLQAGNFTVKALIDSFEQVALRNLTELAWALDKVFQMADENSRVVGKSYSVQPSYIEVHPKRIVLSNEGFEAIKKAHLCTITNEKENEFYNHLRNVQVAYKALRDFTNGHTDLENNDTLIGITNCEILCETKQGRLGINDNVFAFLKK